MILIDSNVPMYLVGETHAHKHDALRQLERLVVERHRLVTVTATVEMSSQWKPQNGSHWDLEISPTARDSHIPTADPRFLDCRKRTVRRQRG